MSGAVHMCANCRFITVETVLQMDLVGWDGMGWDGGGDGGE